MFEGSHDIWGIVVHHMIEDKDVMSILQVLEWSVIFSLNVSVVLYVFFRTSLFFDHGIKILVVHQKLCDCNNHIRCVTSNVMLSQYSA
jgi:hypothetical protein